MVALDIIIPVYNEGKNILPVLEELRSRVKTPYRVLVCYDRDEDTTLVALRDYDSAGVEIVPVKNRRTGAHGAVVTGFKASAAPAVLVMPADDTHNAGIIDELFEKFRQGCDIVAPSRFMPGGCMKGCPWLKAVLVRSAAFTLYHLARLPTHDPTNGFRLFSRRVITEINIESDRGFAFSLELLVKAHRRGWKIAEVPAEWHERSHGKSRFRIGKWLPMYLRWYALAFGTTLHRLIPARIRSRSLAM
jgi:dolichol-phosphate mannosyltransferase